MSNDELEKIIREYIDKTYHVSLATSANNKPWVCEVHFAYDDNLNVYYRSHSTRRHSQEIVHNEFVAGNIVRQHDLGEYPHAIYFEGRAKLLKDETQMDEAAALLSTRLKSAKEDILNDAKKDDGHKLYKVTVDSWYAFGKFGRESGEKYQLKRGGV